MKVGGLIDNKTVMGFVKCSMQQLWCDQCVTTHILNRPNMLKIFSLNVNAHNVEHTNRGVTDSDNPN